ncbi:TAXI family TRAP transporter solute-binding subunit [Vallitalea okinawensis]|uniref:TAXI family TRAP transporter solute-binding subunit n=1 Tax=Vallitalea okinawensis TaxID=2078660 RepID=UPI000CFC69DF|nr:TAXI family TRAP transporter solute-binding subunit [Vallitalea okinawensis]
MKKRNVVTLSVVCLMMVVLVGCGTVSKKQFFNITTGGTGGTYYPVGGALADVLSSNIEGLTVTAQAGNASVGNVNLLSNHETESAFVQNNVAFWAYEGQASFEGNAVDNLRGIASLYPEAIQIVALESSGITSVEDLKGKKVSVGEQGSGVEVDVKNILDVHGLTYDDMSIDYLSFTEAAQKLKDKQIDAAFVTAGYPTSSVMDVSKSRDIVIVPIAEEKVNAMIEKSPYYAQTTIPAGTYDGQDEPVNTATTMAMWVCDAEADDDLVYGMTKALWENRQKLEETHDKGKDITIDTALDGMAIPLHPGAEKYYKEQGIID